MESKKQKWFEASSPILYQKQKPNSIQFSFFHHRLLSPHVIPHWFHLLRSAIALDHRSLRFISQSHLHPPSPPKVYI
ncbi:hypothetical protein P8452_63593 [Trifolium repens]|nr:hypothetical protein P8452_63593 [Trifolium repens]